MEKKKRCCNLQDFYINLYTIIYVPHQECSQRKLEALYGIGTQTRFGPKKSISFFLFAIILL